MSRPKSPASVEQRILAKLRRSSRSSQLTLLGPADFAALGSRRAVDVALHRLARQGMIRRLSQGLYHAPRTHPVLGELTPTADEIVSALAAKHHLRIQPAGAYAANLLGLSEQVPRRIVYLTDGPPRRIRIGKQEVILRRTTPKNMAVADRISGLVIQGLRHIGRLHVDERTVRTLRHRIDPKDHKTLFADARLAPAWIGEIMRQIGSGSATDG
jgi:hypothetical protein